MMLMLMLSMLLSLLHCPILTTARCLPLRPTQHLQLALPLILVLVLKQPHYPSQRQPVYLCLASSTRAGSRRDPVPVRVP